MMCSSRQQRCWCAIALITILLPACSRQHYRNQADREVQYLVAEKSADPRWGMPNFNIAIDPRSRYFEPYPEDLPPMPPDDPASHEFLHEVNGMRGWPHWHDTGTRPRLENTGWRRYLEQYVPITDDGEILLSLESALRLAYIHSPDQQEQLETIYLSALDVSAERFSLQTQFFGGNDTTYRHRGDFPTGIDSNTLQNESDFTVTRRFATAGELLVGFANSIVWQFAGPETNITTSVVNFSLLQPLLRGAGRDVALERLTIVERTLLANLRAYQRYRHGFFTDVAIGESGGGGPNRRGGFLGGTGLTGFSGTGSGGLGGVGAATGFGRGGFGGGGGGTGGGTGFAGGGAGTVGGFIGLLQTLQEIRNTEVSLESQIRTLSLLEANLEAGFIDLVQVDQFRQNIETERATLLQSTNGLENAVENYLTGTLGLPPNIPVSLDDSLIRQFQFIDGRTTTTQNELEDLQDAVGELAEETDLTSTTDLLQKAMDELQQVDEVMAVVQDDLALLDSRVPDRLRTMEPEEQSLFQKEIEVLYRTFGELRQRLDEQRPALEQLVAELTQENQRQTLDKLVVWLRETIALVQETSLVQARARVESIVIEPIEMNAETALRLACANRFDIMNNRASLVDSWRLIQFNADRLQSDLDVVITGNMNNVGDNPLEFRADNGVLRASLQWDPPFQRLLERNNYRQQLIDYQQARRQLIQYYDQIYQSLRQLIRTMEQLQLNLEIQRRAVVIAIRRVDLTREELNEPTAPPEPGQPATQLGPTAAVNLLTALSDLRNTQNNFMSVWLNFYANRMRLARDTGLMQLDESGFWIDAPLIMTAEELPAPVEQLPPPVPEEWIRDAFEGEPMPAPEVPETGARGSRMIQTSYQGEP